MPMSASCSCGAHWTGESMCHCATCHRTMLSLTGFDDHRDRKQGRCYTEAELRKKGMEPNSAGWWRRPMPSDAQGRVKRGRRAR